MCEIQREADLFDLETRRRLGAGTPGCECNVMVVGSIPTQGNELLFIIIIFFALPPWQTVVELLSSATQCAISRKIWRKARKGVS